MARSRSSQKDSSTASPRPARPSRRPLSLVAQHAARQWKQLKFVKHDKAQRKLPEDQRSTPERIPNPCALPADYFTPEGMDWTPSKDGPVPEYTEYDKAVFQKYRIPLIRPSPHAKTSQAGSSQGEIGPVNYPQLQGSLANRTTLHPPTTRTPCGSNIVNTTGIHRDADKEAAGVDRGDEPSSADPLTSENLSRLTSGHLPTSKDERAIEECLRQMCGSDRPLSPPSLRLISDLAPTTDDVSVQLDQKSSYASSSLPNQTALANAHPWVYLKIVLEKNSTLAAFYRPAVVTQLPEAIQNAKAVGIYGGVLQACGQNWLILSHPENRDIMRHVADITKLLTPQGALVTSVGSLAWGDHHLRIVDALDQSVYDMLAGTSMRTLPAQLMAGVMGGLVVWWSRRRAGASQ